MTWRPETPRPALARAAAALLDGPKRTDREIAELAACTCPTVSRARRELQRLGLIEAVPPDARTHRPHPPRPSRARDAIAAGARTPREVADAAGLSIEGARSGLRRTPCQDTADVAAACDSITVTRHLSCQHCGGLFIKPTGWPVRRYCTPGCRKAAEAERARQERRERQKVNGTATRRFPAVRLPPRPDLSRGSCVTGVLPAGYWTSELRDERVAARLACSTCPVLEACAEWSLSLPCDDKAVYGAMTAAERFSRKRQRVQGAALVDA